MEKYISAIVYEFRYLGGRLLKETGLCNYYVDL